MKTWDEFVSLVGVVLFCCLGIASLGGGAMAVHRWWEQRRATVSAEDIAVQIGRYRVEPAGGEGPFLLDSATGQTWRVCRRQYIGDPAVWCVMPPPEPAPKRAAP